MSGSRATDNHVSDFCPAPLISSERHRLRHRQLPALTAEIAIGALEDAEHYKAFEAAVIADYEAQSAVERELVAEPTSARIAAPFGGD
jgi:hypothetical protein